MVTDLFDIFSRGIISFSILFIMARLMGKKQISQLSFFDYVVGISIGSIAAAMAVDDRISYLHGIIALVIYGFLPIIISYITIKSIWARRVFGGIPTILIQNGQIIEENLKKSKFHINDLLEELRIKGTFNVADVEFAILETGGKVSLQLKSQKQPLTPSNLNIPTKYQGLCANLIVDGEIMQEHLSMVNQNESWLLNELKIRNINSPKDVLLASLDTNGELYITKKNRLINEAKVLE